MESNQVQQAAAGLSAALKDAMPRFDEATRRVVRAFAAARPEIDEYMAAVRRAQDAISQNTPPAA
jgi:hypothetical protein